LAIFLLRLNMVLQDKILNLLDQIIEKNILEDSINKKPIESGDNWNVFYLKVLKNLLQELFDKKQNKEYYKIT